MEADGGVAREWYVPASYVKRRKLTDNVGKVKAIGVSNWSIPYLEKLSQTWKTVPAVNQVELHPLVRECFFPRASQKGSADLAVSEPATRSRGVLP